MVSLAFMVLCVVKFLSPVPLPSLAYHTMYSQVTAACTIAKFSLYGTLHRQVPAACTVAKFSLFGTMNRQLPVPSPLPSLAYTVLCIVNFLCLHCC
jgi:hypothetical protein